MRFNRRSQGSAKAVAINLRICGLAGVVLLAGCSFAPPFHRPPLPVPQQFAGLSSDSGSVAAVGWQTFFREPQLQTLIADALANNRDIRIATGRVAEARATWQIQGAPLYPQLDAVATGTRGRSIINLPEIGVQRLDQKQVVAQLSAGWEIDFWGRLRNLRDAAREEYLASEEARRAVAIDLVSQVATGYLQAREYEERAALARRTIETRQEALRIARRRYEVGSDSKLEVTQAQTLLGQAETALHALEQDRGVNLNALEMLVGRPVTIEPDSSAEAWQQTAIPIGLPSDLLVNRPDIVAAEHRLRAANANIGAARAAFLPNINLTGNYGTASSELKGLFGSGSEAWSFTPTITMPLFHGGELAANLDVAQARHSIAVAEYEKAIQTAFRDVSDALVRRQQIGLQIETTVAMVDALSERARLAQLRFENGHSAYLEVLDAQRDLFDTQQTLIELRRAELGSVVALYAALGGGFSPNQTDPEEPAR